VCKDAAAPISWIMKGCTPSEDDAVPWITHTHTHTHTHSLSLSLSLLGSPTPITQQQQKLATFFCSLTFQSCWKLAATQVCNQATEDHEIIIMSATILPLQKKKK
jgi:hypothetical protein